MFVVVFMLLFFEYVLGRMVSPLFNYQTAVFFYLVGALLRKIHDLEVRGGVASVGFLSSCSVGWYVLAATIICYLVNNFMFGNLLKVYL